MESIFFTQSHELAVRTHVKGCTGLHGFVICSSIAWKANTDVDTVMLTSKR